MLEQEESEPAAEFSSRLVTTLDRCAADPGSNDVVLMVVSGCTDDRALTARWNLATTVLANLSKRGGGRLLFTRGYGHDGRPEPALTALAAELATEWAWAGVEVGLRLRDGLRSSQVRRTSAPPSYLPYRADGQPVLQAV